MQQLGKTCTRPRCDAHNTCEHGDPIRIRAIGGQHAADTLEVEVSPEGDAATHDGRAWEGTDKRAERAHKARPVHQRQRGIGKDPIWSAEAEDSEALNGRRNFWDRDLVLVATVAAEEFQGLHAKHHAIVDGARARLQAGDADLALGLGEEDE